MDIKEIELNDRVAYELIKLSGDWAAEDSCYGYCQNDINDLIGNRIFLVQDNADIIGFLFGHKTISKNIQSVIPDDNEVFEIEEIYIKPEFRSKGIGTSLYFYVENILKSENIPYIMLSTSTKNYKAILHFYIDEVGMDFWTARLFKKII